jgi:hypothetical protein
MVKAKVKGGGLHTSISATGTEILGAAQDKGIGKCVQRKDHGPQQKKKNREHPSKYSHKKNYRGDA